MCHCHLGWRTLILKCKKNNYDWQTVCIYMCACVYIHTCRIWVPWSSQHMTQMYICTYMHACTDLCKNIKPSWIDALMHMNMFIILAYVHTCMHVQTYVRTLNLHELMLSCTWTCSIWAYHSGLCTYMHACTDLSKYIKHAWVDALMHMSICSIRANHSWYGLWCYVQYSSCMSSVQRERERERESYLLSILITPQQSETAITDVIFTYDRFENELKHLSRMWHQDRQELLCFRQV